MKKILVFIALFIIATIALTHADSSPESISRLVTYHIEGDFEPGLIEPDSITLNGIRVDGKTPFLPGKYILEISRKGYKTIRTPIIIPNENRPYVIQAKMETLPRFIEFCLSSPLDFEPFYPEVIKFNGKELDDKELTNGLKPGKYELLLQHSGFFDIRENIIITPDETSYEINRFMRPKPVLIRQKITFDIPPGEELGQNYRLTLAPFAKLDAQKEIHDGEEVSPDAYKLRIIKEGYHEYYEEKIFIFRPLTIEQKLLAKPVSILFDITHDVLPSANHPSYQVTLIAGGYPLDITNTKQIKPGRYCLDIRQAGYKFNKKEIYIAPSTHPFKIKEKLIATDDKRSELAGRDLSLHLEHQDIVYVPYEVLVNGKKLSWADTFQPGSELDMVFKFERFETRKEKVKILPGVDRQVVCVPLVPLVKYEIRVARKNELDGIKYEYLFFSDNQPIDPHLIQIKFSLPSQFRCSVMVRNESKAFKVLYGYLYAEIPFWQDRGLYLRDISIAKFVEHLEEVRKRR
ncbi:MAG: hypothetical protein AB1390_11890, partial [Nitrospirota bacterium]